VTLSPPLLTLSPPLRRNKSSGRIATQTKKPRSLWLRGALAHATNS